ncbi:unnamed protein product, partial [Oppiella nova]
VRQIVVSNGGSNFECSSDPEERKQLWKARHELYYSCKALVPNSTALITDVCVPISKLTEMIVKTKELIASEGVLGPMFGHVGDGNFHTILVFNRDNDEELVRVKRVATKMAEIALDLCGTCTGEHGVGRGKVLLMRSQYDSVAIDLMKSIKLTLDPKNLMNPNKFEIQAKNVSVLVENGEIHGFTQTFNGTELETYLGIPYAEPPVGPLRFQRPVPTKKWSKPVEAFQWPNACYQSDVELPLMQNKNRSEDCLYLNVFTPARNGSADALRPVMVWIHGGAFIIGSTSEIQYNPLVLTARGDVVIVSINYRLGALGTLYGGTDDTPGNTLFWDQTLALQWVKTNIKSFGGDPNRVTIFGESAGSMSVSGLILSPKSGDLFQNAIMMSGAALIYGAVETPETALKYWLKQTQLIGCSDKSDHKFTPKIIECLRKAPVEKLAVILKSPFDVSGDKIDVVPMFVVDGQHFTKTPIEMLLSGDHKKGLNLLIGNCQDEGSILLASLVDNITFNMTSPKYFTYNEAFDKLKALSSGLTSSKPINGEEVSKMYFTGLSSKTDKNLLLQEIGVAFGDYAIICPTIQFAKTLSSNDKTHSKVYQYYYNSKFGPRFVCMGSWMGVCHASDLLPVFGQPFLQPDGYLDREREISIQMMDFFINFAKNGTPGVIDGAEWPQYYSVGDHTIAPYYEITNQPKSVTNFNAGLKIDECEYLWDQYNH